MRRTVFCLLLLFAAAFGCAQAEGAIPLGSLPFGGEAQTAEDDSLALWTGGVPLPYDDLLGAYLLPGSMESALEYVSVSGAQGDLRLYMTEDGFGVSSGVAASRVILTNLPVIVLTTQSGGLPGEADELGQITLFEAQGGALEIHSSPIEINLRGNTSKRLPKKSYRVKIIDEQGEKRDLSIAGLRSDDDWILNPMYADTSKIREKLAYELWDTFNSSGQAAASSRLEYAEVFINGEYWGLYGVQERVDRKQVDADKRSGILYKVVANEKPGIDELLACESGEVCGGFELEHAGAGVKDPWEAAAKYLAILEGTELAVHGQTDMDNVIDYGLWAMFTQAHDCHFKNQFLHGVYTGAGYTLYKIPWDLNNTFGDVWEGDAQQTNYTEYRIGSLVMDSSFALLVESGDEQVYRAIQARWEQLRKETLTEEKLTDAARGLFADIFGALERDNLRWPQAGMGNGNARNIRDIESFIASMLPRMDEFTKTLTDGE